MPSSEPWGLFSLWGSQKSRAVSDFAWLVIEPYEKKTGRRSNVGKCESCFQWLKYLLTVVMATAGITTCNSDPSLPAGRDMVTPDAGIKSGKQWTWDLNPTQLPRMSHGLNSQ